MQQVTSKYETTRKEFFEQELQKMSPLLAEFLDDGFSLEISRSRSGLKVSTTTRRHIVLPPKNKAVNLRGNNLE